MFVLVTIKFVSPDAKYSCIVRGSVLLLSNSCYIVERLEIRYDYTLRHKWLTATVIQRIKDPLHPSIVHQRFLVIAPSLMG